MRIVVLLALIALPLTAHRAKAQDYVLDFYGLQLSCEASNGQLVPIYTDADAAAAADPLGGARADYSDIYGFTIAMNLDRLSQVPALAAIMVFFHECAHVALPMGVGLQSPFQERNADCYAIRAMVGYGLIENWEQFDEAMQYIIQLSGGHGVDYARIQAMASCV